MTLDELKAILPEYGREVVIVNKYGMIVTDYIDGRMGGLASLGFIESRLPEMTETDIREALERPMMIG